MKLFLRKHNCIVSETIQKNMVNELWQLVEVHYVSSTKPFLQTEEEKILTEPEEIIEYLRQKAKISPSAFEQLKSASQAAKRVFDKVIKGERIRVEHPVVLERKEICNNCIYKTTTLKMDRCKKCGCFLKAKQQLLTEKCPEGKW